MSRIEDLRRGLRARRLARMRGRTTDHEEIERSYNPRVVGRNSRATRRPLVRTLARAQVRSASSDETTSRLLDILERQNRDTSAALRAMQTKVAYLERSTRRRTLSLPGVEDGGSFRGVKRKFMFSRAINFLLTGREEGNEFEVEVFQQMEKRRAEFLIHRAGQVAGVDSLGGFLIPTEASKELIDLIKAESIAIACGVRTLDNLKGSPVEFNKKTGATSASWVGESGEPTESEITFGQVSLTPKTLCAFGVLSKRFINLADEDAEAMLRSDLAEQMALAEDDAIFHGTGAEGQPIGIANMPGLLSYAMGTDGGPITWEHLVKMVHTVRAAKGLKNAKKVGWAFPTELIPHLQLLKDDNGRPLLLEGTAATLPNEMAIGKLLGYPAFDTTEFPTDLTKGAGTDLGEVFFGDFDAIMRGAWGGLEIAASDQAGNAFKRRQVHVIAARDIDVGCRQEERMLYCSDVETSLS